jgi:thioesterase domain-containing protein
LCERILGRSPIGVMDDFFALGGNSLTAFELVEAVHQELGVGVPLSSFFRAPTVEGLCAALSDASAVADRLLVPLATGPAASPLYLVHPHGGGIASYVSLGRELDGRLTVHGIEAVGYNTDATPLDTVPAIADRYLAEISSVTADRPRLLAGWSFGGVVAFEMAVRLEQAGRPVDALLLLDSPPPGSEGLRGDEDVIYRLGADAGLAEDEMTALDDDQLIAALVRSAHEAGRLPDRLKSSAVRRMVAVARANGVAAARYHTDATITADVYLLTVSANHPTLTSPDIDPAAWQARTSGRVHEVRVSGSHYDMVHQPHAAELASRIADIVRTVRNGVPLEDK